MAVYSLITPDDVRSYIAFCLTAHKTSKKLYINTIKKWIISRTHEVVEYHCFIMITLYCPNLLKQLKEQEMDLLLSRMKQSVNDCLNYTLLFRQNSPGRRQSNWQNNHNPWKKISDSSKEIPIFTESDWNSLNPRLIYPRKVNYHFDIYEHEIRSFESFRLLHYGDSVNFIRKQYINGIHKSQVPIDITDKEATSDTVNSNRVPNIIFFDDKKQTHVQNDLITSDNQDNTLPKSNTADSKLITTNIKTGTGTISSTVKSKRVPSPRLSDDLKHSHVQKKTKLDDVTEISYQPRTSNNFNTTTVTVKKPITNTDVSKDGTPNKSEINTDISNLKSNIEHIEHIKFLYKLIDLQFPKHIQEYDSINPKAFKAGLYAAKEYLKTCKSYLNEARPSKKRVKYILSKNHSAIDLDSDLDDYDDFRSPTNNH